MATVVRKPVSTAMFKVAIVVLAVSISGCATSAVVGGAVAVTKVAAKTTVGAGKLAYRGTKAAVKGTAALLTDEVPEEDLEREVP